MVNSPTLPEVTVAYNECIQAQAELHKATRRLKRLKAMKLELTESGEFITKKSRLASTSKLDRWTIGGILRNLPSLTLDKLNTYPRCLLAKSESQLLRTS